VKTNSFYFEKMKWETVKNPNCYCNYFWRINRNLEKPEKPQTVEGGVLGLPPPFLLSVLNIANKT
jgi:hypothetical protein